MVLYKCAEAHGLRGRISRAALPTPAAPQRGRGPRFSSRLDGLELGVWLWRGCCARQAVAPALQGSQAGSAPC